MKRNSDIENKKSNTEKNLSDADKKLQQQHMEKTAIALRYDSDLEAAPRIVATGKGYIADKIIDIAKKENVPIHRDDAVARTLSKLDFGDTIPPELYEVVAQILIYVDRVDGLKGKR